MEAVLERCAGLDIHRDTIHATILWGPVDQKPSKLHHVFQTTTEQIKKLAQWLSHYRIKDVVMESTGIYWKPIWNLMEDAFHLVLANAKTIKNMPGRKTDRLDSEWLAEIYRCGLVTASFVPRREIRELREYTRSVMKLRQNISTYKNRIHKVLESSNIKLSVALTNLFGVSGRALLQSIIDGEVLTESQVRQMVKFQLKKKTAVIVQALNGSITPSQRQLLDHYMSIIHFFERQVEAIAQHRDQLITDYFSEERDLLLSIYGVSQDAAAVILAEIGNKMQVFGSSAKLSSWAGLCPGNHESAGKKRDSHIGKGNKYLKSILVQSAWVAVKKKQSRMRSYYQRLKTSQGSKRAIVATAHLLLRIIYQMLSKKEPYLELGQDYLNREIRVIRKWIKKLEQKGFSLQAQTEESKALIKKN